MKFDHIGLPTTDVKEGENWITFSKVWVTKAEEHPFHVEWLRFAPDSPVRAELKTTAHVAFRVKDLEGALVGNELLLGPFVSDLGARVAFIKTPDGAVIEFMEEKACSDWR